MASSNPPTTSSSKAARRKSRQSSNSNLNNQSKQSVNSSGQLNPTPITRTKAKKRAKGTGATATANSNNNIDNVNDKLDNMNDIAMAGMTQPVATDPMASAGGQGTMNPLTNRSAPSARRARNSRLDAVVESFPIPGANAVAQPGQATHHASTAVTEAPGPARQTARQSSAPRRSRGVRPRAAATATASSIISSDALENNDHAASADPDMPLHERQIGGYALADAGLAVTRELNADELAVMNLRLAAEFRRQQDCPPICPDFWKSLDAKEITRETIPIPPNATDEVRLEIEAENNKIMEHRKMVDRKRNGQSARKSREYKAKVAAHSLRMNKEQGAHIAWLSLKLVQAGGDPAEWEQVGADVKKGMVREIQGRMAVIERERLRRHQLHEKAKRVTRNNETKAVRNQKVEAGLDGYVPRSSAAGTPIPAIPQAPQLFPSGQFQLPALPAGDLGRLAYAQPPVPLGSQPFLPSLPVPTANSQTGVGSQPWEQNLMHLSLASQIQPQAAFVQSPSLMQQQMQQLQGLQGYSMQPQQQQQMQVNQQFQAQQNPVQQQTGAQQMPQEQPDFISSIMANPRGRRRRKASPKENNLVLPRQQALDVYNQLLGPGSLLQAQNPLGQGSLDQNPFGFVQQQDQVQNAFDLQYESPLKSQDPGFDIEHNGHLFGSNVDLDDVSGNGDENAAGGDVDPMLWQPGMEDLNDPQFG